MSIQPHWIVRDYQWCPSCGARVVNEHDDLCTMCAAFLRNLEIDQELADLELVERLRADDLDTDRTP